MKFNLYQIYKIVAATLVSVGGAFLFLNGESGSLQELFNSSYSLQYSLLAIGGWSVTDDPWSSQYEMGSMGVDNQARGEALHLGGQAHEDINIVLETAATGNVDNCMIRFSRYGYTYVDLMCQRQAQGASGIMYMKSNNGTPTDCVMWACTDDKMYIGGTDTTPTFTYNLEVEGTFYSSGSSMDYKQEVQDYKPNADAIMNLRPVHYEYKDEWKKFGKRLANNNGQIGLVAEEVAEVMPELAVMREEDGKNVVRNVDYEKLTVVLLSEIQELKREVKALKGRV